MNFIDLPNNTLPNSIETCSGLYVDVANPLPETLRVEDMAWALSRQARFAGHTLSDEIWSIGQHSLFVEYLVDLVMSEDGIQLHWSLIEWLAAKGMVGEYEAGRFSKPLTRMWSLVHDCPEAYLVDIPSPVKRHPAIQGPYSDLEKKMEDAMCAAFYIRRPTKLEHMIVKWGDMLALRIEAANLLPSRGRGWGINMPRMNHADMHLFPKVKRWREVCEDFVERWVLLRHDAMRDSMEQAT